MRMIDRSGSCGWALSLFSGAVCRRPVPPPPTHHNRSVSAAAGAPAETFAPTLISFDNLGIRSVEIDPRQREQDSRRLRTVRLVRVRTVPARIYPQPIAVPGVPTPMEPIPIGPEQPCPVAILDNNSPAARARRARRKLGRLFEKARRAAQGQARFARDDEYHLLNFAYGAVRRWKREGVGQEIERELRAEAQVPMSRMSSLFLVLLRSALPRLDGKRASKMALALSAADDQGVTAKRLAAFLWHNGGIEGAARQRASAVRRASSRF